MSACRLDASVESRARIKKPLIPGTANAKMIAANEIVTNSSIIVKPCISNFVQIRTRLSGLSENPKSRWFFMSGTFYEFAADAFSDFSILSLAVAVAAWFALG